MDGTRELNIYYNTVSPFAALRPVRLARLLVLSFVLVCVVSRMLSNSMN